MLLKKHDMKYFYISILHLIILFLLSTLFLSLLSIYNILVIGLHNIAIILLEVNAARLKTMGMEVKPPSLSPILFIRYLNKVQISVRYALW